MKSPKTKKVVRAVKAWAITNKRNHGDIYAAYTEEGEAMEQKRKFPKLHEYDVILPCLISTPTKKSAGKRKKRV